MPCGRERNMETLESYAMCSDGDVGCSHVFNQFGKKKHHKLSHFIIQIKQKKSRNSSGSIKKVFIIKLHVFSVWWFEHILLLAGVNKKNPKSS